MDGGKVPDGKPLRLDATARSSSRDLPAFLARPADAPVYHGFPLVEETRTDCWCYGAITEFEEPDGCTEGDGFVVTPDGSRAGLMWSVGTFEVEQVSPPDAGRWGVYAVAFPRPVRTKADLVECFRAVLPQLRAIHATVRGRALHPQLERIGAELADARHRAHELAAPLTAELWGTRPAAGQWSVAECLIHLNLTSCAFLPLIRDAIGKGRDLKLLGAGPYRRDLMCWLLCWVTEPPVRFRVKTTEPFVPAGVEPKERVLADFDALQEQMAGCVREADGLDLGRLRVVSLFDSRVKYNLYSCLRLIAAHQRQHLAQAREAISSLGRTGGAG